MKPIKKNRMDIQLVQRVLMQQPKGIALSSNPKDQIWLTAEGRKITPKEMDDRHLLNCIRLLERRAAEMKAQLPSVTQSPQEIANRLWPIHGIMVKEMEGRLNKEVQPTLVMQGVKRRFSFD